ncbi:MAG: AtpZ/AtpI family protein [Acidobacteriota bacterium]
MAYRVTKSAGEALRSIGALSTVGLAFVLAIVIGAWFGSVLDGWLGTKPVFFIVFFFLGLAAGMLNVFRTVARTAPRGPAPGKTRPGEAGPSDREFRGPDE